MTIEVNGFNGELKVRRPKGTYYLKQYKELAETGRTAREFEHLHEAHSFRNSVMARFKDYVLSTSLRTKIKPYTVKVKLIKKR